jgi:hypothetical protein
VLRVRGGAAGVCTVGVRNATSATRRVVLGSVGRRLAAAMDDGRWVVGGSLKSGRRQYATVHGDVKLYREAVVMRSRVEAVRCG